MKTQKNDLSYLLFEANGHRFGIPAKDVLAVAASEEATPLPQAKGFVLGYMNLRGSPVLVMEFSSLFKLGASEKGGHVILVDGREQGDVGLLVNNVKEVMHLKGKRVGSARRPSSIPASKYFKAVEVKGERIILINSEGLLSSDELSSIYAPPRKTFTAPEARGFVFRNGVVARSLPELIECLKAIDDETLSHHLNASANHFVPWITDVLMEKGLGEQVSGLHTRQEIISSLQAFRQ